jgi:hypothetical protein
LQVQDVYCLENRHFVLPFTQKNTGRGTGRGVLGTSISSTKTSVTGPPQRKLPDLKLAGAADPSLNRQSDAVSRAKPVPPAKPVRPKSSTMSDAPSPPRTFQKASPRKDSGPTVPNSNRVSIHPQSTRMSTLFVPRTGPPPEIQGLPTAVAVDDYDAENHRELSFKVDDVIHVTFWSPATTWWKGWFSGQIGYFPKESVKPRFDVDESSSQASVASRSDSQDKKRRQLIHSIVTSEELHVKDLQVVQEVLVHNLQTVLTAADISEIFGNIETIVTESKATLVLFQRKARTEEPIGDVFLRMAEMFHEHVIPWAANQVHMVCAMEKLNGSNSGFASCLQSIAEQCRGLTIYEWLSKPARRAVEFSQIVALMLSKTPSTHVDHAQLTQASDIMAEVKEALRVPSEELENLLKIVTLQNSLQGQESLVSPTRKFVREVTLQEVVGKKSSDRKAYLLSDQLVVVKLKRTGFGQPVFYALNRVTVSAVSDAGPLRNMWELTVNQGGSKKDKVRFAMASPADRDLFVKQIDNQITLQMSQPTSGNLPDTSVRGSNTSVNGQAADTFGKKSGFIKILQRPSQRSFSVSEESPPNIAPPQRTSSRANLNASIDASSPSSSSSSLKQAPVSNNVAMCVCVLFVYTCFLVSTVWIIQKPSL